MTKSRKLIISYFKTAELALQHAQELKRWEISNNKVKFIAVEYIRADQAGKLKVYKIRQATPTSDTSAAALKSSESSPIVGTGAAPHVSSSVASALFRKNTGMDEKDRKHLLQQLADGFTALLVLADGPSADIAISKLTILGVAVESFRLPEQTFSALVTRHEENLSQKHKVDPHEKVPKVGIISKTVLHYHRHNSDYEGWGLHVWTGCEHEVTWQVPLRMSGTDDFGAIFEVPLAKGDSGLSYVIHKGDEKDLLEDQFLDFGAVGHEVWIIQNTPGYLPAPAPVD